MADFMTDLWNAVFEAGPTPTLLLATNATFAALQTLLFALLLATYSIHFVVLSVLCGGLWYAINWFAAELRAAQQQEESAKAISKYQEQDTGNTGNQDNRAEDKVIGTDATRDHQAASVDYAAAALYPESANIAAAATGPDSSQPTRAVGHATSRASDAQEGRVPSIRQRSMHGTTADIGGEPTTDSDWEQIDGEP